jgi:hypothetical protein
MLDKLAKIAQSLDIAEQYDLADQVTEVIKKYALAQVNNDDNIIPRKSTRHLPPRHHKWVEELDKPTIDLRKEYIRDRAGEVTPDIIDEIMNIQWLPGQDIKTWHRPYDIIGPYGTKRRLTPDMKRRLLYEYGDRNILAEDQPGTLMYNGAVTRELFDKWTENGEKPRLLGTQMLSGRDPFVYKENYPDVENPQFDENVWRRQKNGRSLLYTPEAKQLIKMYGFHGKNDERLPLLDYKVLAGIMDRNSTEWNDPHYKYIRANLRNIIKNSDHYPMAKDKYGNVTKWGNDKTHGFKYVLDRLFRKIDPTAVTSLEQRMPQDKGGKFKPFSFGTGDLRSLIQDYCNRIYSETHDLPYDDIDDDRLNPWQFDKDSEYEQEYAEEDE